MRKLYLYGASGHAKVLIEIAEELGCEIGGLVDDNPRIRTLFGYMVNSRFISENGDWIVSIGDNHMRKKVVERMGKRGYTTLDHPQAVISDRAEVSVGTAVMAGVTINSGTSVGRHCIINTNASVDHDCVLGDYVHIAPNVAIAGGVIVGEGTFVGIGACVVQGINIGRWCTIGAGAVILEDISDGVTVVGNPGRIIKEEDVE